MHLEPIEPTGIWCKSNLTSYIIGTTIYTFDNAGAMKIITSLKIIFIRKSGLQRPRAHTDIHVHIHTYIHNRCKKILNKIDVRKII